MYLSNKKRLFVWVQNVFVIAPGWGNLLASGAQRREDLAHYANEFRNSAVLYLSNMKRVFVVNTICNSYFIRLTSQCPSKRCREESVVCQWIPQFCNFASSPLPRVSIYAKSSSLLFHFKCEGEEKPANLKHWKSRGLKTNLSPFSISFLRNLTDKQARLGVL